MAGRENAASLRRYHYRPVIYLTRLNNSQVTVNSDLIKFVEQSPDTVITLLNGEKILVQETVNEVVKRVMEFRRQILPGMAMRERMRTGALALCDGAPHDTSEGQA
ncbi:MAG TPA: flagellar FlbD family protein [Terriglobales bacterium]|jgi:flagellar protein FlbD